jgi:hypothetical protein
VTYISVFELLLMCVRKEKYCSESVSAGERQISKIQSCFATHSVSGYVCGGGSNAKKSAMIAWLYL